jgi:hypothetical protein
MFRTELVDFVMDFVVYPKFVVSACVILNGFKDIGSP